MTGNPQGDWAPPSDAALRAALERTWPPAAIDDATAPGWRLRDGAGGGSRVSAATALGPGGAIETAEAAMRARGQRPLFRLSTEEKTLDAALAARGHALLDPTMRYVGDARRLAAGRPPEGVRIVELRTRLALIDEIWDAGGIDAARRAVMARARDPKAVLMARSDMAVAGCAFVALDGDVAMIHAIEVPQDQRRKGAGAALVAGAAGFALERGARTLALAVTRANDPARALYARMGMVEAGGYHYRIAPA